MKAAIISDTHDHILNTRRAIDQANSLGAEVLIHCGDLVSPFMLEELDAFRGTVHLIFGNNPGDQPLLVRSCEARGEKITLHGWAGRLDLGGRAAVIVHEPFHVMALARSRDFDLVLFGHTHRWHREKVGRTLVVNPGEILGRKEEPGWALLDTERMTARRVLLAEEITERPSL